MPESVYIPQVYLPILYVCPPDVTSFFPLRPYSIIAYC